MATGALVPVRILSVATNGDAETPGVTPEQAGGIPARGPRSFAVEEPDLFIWDQARLRVLVYQQRFSKAVSIPSVDPRAVALLVTPGHYYLRIQGDSAEPWTEFEIDSASGRILRTAEIRTRGDPPLYPRTRPGRPPAGEKGAGADGLGADMHGNRYERFARTSGCDPAGCIELRRVDPTGRVSAVLFQPTDARWEDLYVSSRGGLYGLRWERDAAGQIVAASVFRLIPPV